MASHGGRRRSQTGVVSRTNVRDDRDARDAGDAGDARGTGRSAPCAILKAGDPGHCSVTGFVTGLASWLASGRFVRPMIRTVGLTMVLAIALTMVPAFFPGTGVAATCTATGRSETTPADVYEARMAAKAADGAFDFSSGAMEAAKVCADLINRLSSVTLSGIGVPTLEDVMQAVQDILEETVEEACRYVANTTTNWVRSQTSYARQSANSTASSLVGARVNVSNPSASSVAATYRSRLRQNLPTYSDLPSLRDLQ